MPIDCNDDRQRGDARRFSRMPRSTARSRRRFWRFPGRPCGGKESPGRRAPGARLSPSSSPHHRQYRRSVGKTVRQSQRRRRVAAGAPQQARLAGHDPHDGIIHPPGDIAVVHQEAIGNAAERAPRLVVVDALRLVREVAAGQHDRPVDPAEQQMMQRRVRQHDPERADTGRDSASGDTPVGAPRRQQHDRRGGAFQQRHFPRAPMSQYARATKGRAPSTPAACAAGVFSRATASLHPHWWRRRQVGIRPAP